MCSARALHYDYDDYNDSCEREQRVGDDRRTRRLQRQESLLMVRCHRMCDYHHYSPEEEERPTTMITTIGGMAQGEGCHYDSMTGSTAMVTTMQDRLQERSESKRTTTSLDYIIRLTDRCRKPQIFADFTPSPTNSSIWRAQETAENRRFSQETEDFRRKPQIGLRHLRCVTFSSAL